MKKGPNYVESMATRPGLAVSLTLLERLFQMSLFEAESITDTRQNEEAVMFDVGDVPSCLAWEGEVEVEPWNGRNRHL